MMTDSVMDNFKSHLPQEQHQIAYEIWSTHHYPSMHELCQLLGVRYDTYAPQFRAWKDGTYKCECPWHLWIYKEAERRRLFEIAEDQIDFVAFQAEKDKVYETINLKRRSEIRLIQLVIDTIAPYITGKKAITEDGEVIVIPRIQPRSWKDLVDTLDKLVKLKQLVTGGPTERSEIVPSFALSPGKLDTPEEYQKYIEAESQDLVALLQSLDEEEN